MNVDIAGKKPQGRLIVSFVTMLTLDCSTLFYWNLASNHFAPSVDSWAKSIATNTKPPSQAPSRAPSTTATTVTFTNASSRSESSRVKSEPDAVDYGGLSDHDEVRGLERDAAVMSPPKGKKRVHSEESSISSIQSYIYLIISYNRLSSSKLSQKLQRPPASPPPQAPRGLEMATFQTA